jgi:hypothetical protein
VLAKFLRTTPGFHQFCCSTEEVRAALAAVKVFSFVSGQREREREREREKAAVKDSSFCCIFSPILEGWVRGDVAGQKREKKVQRPSRKRMADATAAASSSRGGGETTRRVLFVSAGASHTVALLCKHFVFFFSLLSLPSFLH